MSIFANQVLILFDYSSIYPKIFKMRILQH